MEDRRGTRGKRVAAGGGVGVIVIALIVWALGGDPMALLNQSGGLSTQIDTGSYSQSAPASPADDAAREFIERVLGSTEEVWVEEFANMGRQYAHPRLVLFTESVQSGCGFAGAQMGPFYCPADSQIYIDLSFYDQLAHRHGAPGDFAQAYVIAHEVGHHIQNLLGISTEVHRAKQSVSKTEGNQLSVRLELQADFLAGLWARRGQEKFAFLEEGDLEEALQAANAIGDDTLQRQGRGHVVPDSFTHGTSEQRMRWFKKGFRGEAFDPQNTFSISAREL